MSLRLILLPCWIPVWPQWLPHWSLKKEYFSRLINSTDFDIFNNTVRGSKARLGVPASVSKASPTCPSHLTEHIYQHSFKPMWSQCGSKSYLKFIWYSVVVPKMINLVIVAPWFNVDKISLLKVVSAWYQFGLNLVSVV